MIYCVFSFLILYFRRGLELNESISYRKENHMFNFGEQLKELRKSKELTQEQAAELLGISKQSVSRWENNSTYPDIMLLPTLASFYGVTVDRLLGVDSDENEKMRKEYFENIEKARRLGDERTAFLLSQELYARFPNEKDVIISMIGDAYVMGIHGKAEEKKHYFEMAIAVAQRFLKMAESIEDQCYCIKNIAVCYKLMGEQEKATRWANKLPTIWQGVEAVHISVLEEKEKYPILQKHLHGALILIYRLLYAFAENPENSAAHRAEILEKIPSLFDTLFENGDYGFYHGYISRIYLEIARSSIENAEKALDCIEKAVKHAIERDAVTPSKHTSILFSGWEMKPDEWENGKTVCQRTAVLLDNSDFDAIRTDKRFKAAVKSLG